MNPKDLLIEAYDPQPGGMKPVQLVAGVKITHIPTGNVVLCMSERVQHKNKQLALEAMEWLLN